RSAASRCTPCSAPPPPPCGRAACASAAASTTAPTCRASPSSATAPSPTRSTATSSARPTASSSSTNPTASPSSRLERCHADVGEVGDDAVDAEGGQLAHGGGVVDGPGVDLEAGGVGGGDELGSDRGVVRMPGGVPALGGGVDRPLLIEGGDGQQGGRNARTGGAHGVDRGQVERRDDHAVLPAAGDDETGHRAGDGVALVVVGVDGRVLDLDVDAHARAGVEGL